MAKAVHDNEPDRATAGVAIATRTDLARRPDTQRDGSRGGAPVLLARDRLRWFGLGVDGQGVDGEGAADDSGE